MSHNHSRAALLDLYKKLLRACETYPSKNRASIYEAIREEWRDSVHLTDETPKRQRQISVAYKGLEQLRQFDVATMTGGNPYSANWNVTLEQNPMPKPADYDERRNQRKGKK